MMSGINRPTGRPVASLSLDLDNQWSYMKTHGDAGWSEFPSYLDQIVPRVLEMFANLDLRATIFIVGQDAALPVNAAALRSVAEAGHEIGNHSFHHEPWLHLYTPEQIDQELASAEDAIGAVTGVKTRGFRGPGFSISEATLAVLAERGYAYDCSTFPTYLGPLARAYYFRTARLSADERKQRSALFGSFHDGLRPLTPYRWDLGTSRLLEIPVTTLPGLKLPFHLSYVIYLARQSEWLARRYFASSIALCRATGIAPSLLLHPLDFIGGDELDTLRFFPGMDMPGAVKRRIVCDSLLCFARSFQIGTMTDHAAWAECHIPLASITPSFAHHPAAA